ncbi:MAG: lamin tail domain-containing protein [Verrucomicrobiota bacterium]
MKRFVVAGLLAAALRAHALDSVVTFNELQYHPAEAGGTEWIELHNQNGVNVDLSGWHLSGGVDYQFPNGTVIPGKGFLVISQNPAAGPATGALGPWAGSLNNTGELVQLLDNNLRIMDGVEYGDKGEWPIAPDGSGTTLTKRSGSGGSREASAWTASPRAGGTPGAVNFASPAAPVTTRVTEMDSLWRYLNTGSVPAAAWKDPGFEASAWPEGPGAFTFGGGTLYGQAGETPAAGSWSAARWTGDADSGVASGKIYTHAVVLNRGAAVSLNGVTFTAPGAEVRQGADWSLTGASASFTNNGSGNGFNTLPAGSASRALTQEFFYGEASATTGSTLNLSGLTPGRTYTAVFYATGFGDAESRRMRITPDNTGTPVIIDENAPGSGKGLLARYQYQAPADGDISFQFVALTAGATWHHYAFSNEVSEALPAESALTTAATVSSVSSELTGGTFTRDAGNTVNHSGLTANGGVHGTVADGAMWLTRGTFSAPNDPLPAYVIYDLGAAKNLTSLRIWNYNERPNASTDLTNRGAREVDISTADAVGGTFMPAGRVTLDRALGVTSEIGQRIPLARNGVRLVRLDIVSNHGDSQGLAGLSEIKFMTAASGSAGTPVGLREKIATLYNSGVDDSGAPLAPGKPDPHYLDVASNKAVTAMTPHSAWLGDDGVSRFVGFTGSGTDNAPAGTFTFRTTFDLSDYLTDSAAVNLYVAADNSLDSVKLNGLTVAGAAYGAFNAYGGPFALAGFASGLNTVELKWTNASTAANPGGIRIKWDASAEAKLGGTVLPANPVTTWFRRSFTLGGEPGTSYSALLRHGVDDGAVFYLNGQEVQRFNLPAGPLTADSTALENREFPSLSSSILLSGAALQPGENVLAVELHQAAGAGLADAFFGCTLDVTATPPAISDSTVLSFDKLSGAAGGALAIDLKNGSGSALALSGYTLKSSSGASIPLSGSIAAGARLTLTAEALGFTLADGDKLFLTGPGSAILDAAVMKNRAQARNADGRWLTPSALNPGGEATFAVPDSVVINEIMYHQHPAYLPTGTVESGEEWIEFYNKSDSPADLTGWRVEEGITFDFPAGTVIPAGAYLVLAREPAVLAAKYPGIAITGPFKGSLSNSGEVIRLVDANSNPADEVRYFDSGRWDGKADGGGSSLELTDPRADNSVPEAWAASDESAKSEWQTFTYTGTGAPPPGSNDPTRYNEFIFGLLNAGECMVDDVSVKQVTSANRELIQNRDFTSGNADKWRLLGTHGSHKRSIVMDDVLAPGNKALRITATGAAEHMHNHVETTLKADGAFVALSSSATYTINFRARWVSGCPRLQTRLYFNRLAKQHLLTMPERTGTPGSVNSRRTANAGPVFNGLSHYPVVPASGAPVTVRVHAADPHGLGAVTLKWRRDGVAAWSDLPMTSSGGGQYEAIIPGQSGGALAEFYVSAADAAAVPVVSVFPAGAPTASSGLVKWNDGTVPPGPGHGLRILMTTANQNFLHLPTNVMSNDNISCTVIYRESEVFYDTRVSLKSSQRGRLADIRLGFAVDFDPMQPFRGVMTTINLDRSSYGRGTTSSGYGQGEIINWHFFNKAGGIPSMYNDLVYLISPRAAHTGSASLTMAELNDPYLDGQYENGGDTPTFKWELIYYPLSTSDGTPEGLKIPNPDEVNGININSLTSPDKEAYRWHFLIGNARENDDYSRIVNLAATFRKTGTAYREALPQAIDVDEWLRCFAAFALAGIGDHYTTSASGWHNLKLYQRADGRILFLPWDGDFANQPANASTRIQQDLLNMLAASPAYDRAFYGHLQDIMGTAFNAAHIGPWATHYGSFTTTGGNWNEITDYVTARVAFVKAELNTRYPALAFAITTNGGNGFSEPGSEATLAGNAWVNVRGVRLAGSGTELPLTWTTRNAWTTKIPVSPGVNQVTIEAIDYQGLVVGTDTITVTGTGATELASAANLVISELHYHPGDVTAAETAAGFTDENDFEFIELRNLSATAILLTGAHFDGGITWTAPAGTTLAPGAFAVIPRRAAAFALRHPGVATLPEYYAATGNVLSNSSDELVLLAAGGADIQRFTYSDSSPWPTAADGDGPSLALIAPMLNPDPKNPMNWRLSTTANGNPGASDADAAPANPANDDDGDGVSNLEEYVFGPGGGTSSFTVTPAADGVMDFRFTRRAGADARLRLETSADLSTWQNTEFTLTSRAAPAAGGMEELSVKTAAPAVIPNAPAPLRRFIRVRMDTR